MFLLFYNCMLVDDCDERLNGQQERDRHTASMKNIYSRDMRKKNRAISSWKLIWRWTSLSCSVHIISLSSISFIIFYAGNAAVTRDDVRVSLSFLYSFNAFHLKDERRQESVERKKDREPAACSRAIFLFRELLFISSWFSSNNRVTPSGLSVQRLKGGPKE